MSVVQVSSNVHGQLDAQIEQLTQCKPLPEQEVFFFRIPSLLLLLLLLLLLGCWFSVTLLLG
jgi:hypothetical protein